MIETNVFTQDIPDFVSGFERIKFEFNSTEELLSNPVVKQWKYSDNAEKSFFRYSLSEDMLMAEFDRGKGRMVGNRIYKISKSYQFS